MVEPLGHRPGASSEFEPGALCIHAGAQQDARGRGDLARPVRLHERQVRLEAPSREHDGGRPQADRCAGPLVTPLDADDAPGLHDQARGADVPHEVHRAGRQARAIQGLDDAEPPLRVLVEARDGVAVETLQAGEGDAERDEPVVNLGDAALGEEPRPLRVRVRRPGG